MAAAAHTPGGYGGVPQKVGKEFNAADAKTGILKKKKKRPAAIMYPKHTKSEHEAGEE